MLFIYLTNKYCRCFPTCAPSGHVSHGFCGDDFRVSLFVEINEESPPCHLFDSFWCSDVLYIAEMKCSTELTQDRFISKSTVLSKLRTRNTKCQPYIRGTLVQIETTNENLRQVKRIDLVFNEDHNAWHYGWVSHKCTSERTHVLDIMVLVENDMPENYFLAASFPSPEFIVTSTKAGRQRQREEESIDIP